MPFQHFSLQYIAETTFARPLQHVYISKSAQTRNYFRVSAENHLFLAQTRNYFRVSALLLAVFC
jgi:hypothetical protein